jgi:hypothetical protein
MPACAIMRSIRGLAGCSMRSALAVCTISCCAISRYSAIAAKSSGVNPFEQAFKLGALIREATNMPHSCRRCIVSSCFPFTTTTAAPGRTGWRSTRGRCGGCCSCDGHSSVVNGVNRVLTCQVLSRQDVEGATTWVGLDVGREMGVAGHDGGQAATRASFTVSGCVSCRIRACAIPVIQEWLVSRFVSLNRPVALVLKPATQGHADTAERVSIPTRDAKRHQAILLGDEGHCVAFVHLATLGAARLQMSHRSPFIKNPCPPHCHQ